MKHFYLSFFKMLSQSDLPIFSIPQMKKIVFTAFLSTATLGYSIAQNISNLNNGGDWGTHAETVVVNSDRRGSNHNVGTSAALRLVHDDGLWRNIWAWMLTADHSSNDFFLSSSKNGAGSSWAHVTKHHLQIEEASNTWWFKQAIMSDIKNLTADDYVFGKNRLITDGDIELGPNKVIRKRGSGSGHLSFTGFTEYRFDKPLSDPNSNLVLNDNVDLNFKLSFKPGTFRQMIDLWGTEYAIGIQSHTQYYRTHSNFAWYRGGTHNNNERNPGGGNVDMVLERGKLGIGLGNPTTKLDVNGTSRFRDFATFDAGADVTGTLKNQHIQINSDHISADGLPGTQDLLLTDNNGINLRSDNIALESKDGNATTGTFTIKSTRTNLETDLYGKNGSVTFKDAVFIESADGLTVQQTINAQDLNITPGAAPGAPDYVFEKGYQLRPLEEVQKHIKKKGRLPEVPSAKEIEEEGYTMVEMDFILLKKVEELTLYLLDLKKENEEQAQQIAKLAQENKKLRAKEN